MTTPVFTHQDCDVCVFLGHEGGKDHYICDPRGMGAWASLIARDGNEGGDYETFPRKVAQRIIREFPGCALETTERLARQAGYHLL